MKKLLLFLSILCLSVNLYAQDTKTFPAEGNIPFLGLDDTSDPLQAKDGRCADIQNVTLELDGTAHKRYGYSTRGGTLDTNDTTDDFEPVTGLYELVKSDTTRKFIATCANKIFYYNSGTWTKLTSPTITEGQDYQFVWTTALDTAIGTNNQDAPISWTGTGSAGGISWGSLSYPVTKANCVAYWKNYLIFGNITENSVAHATRIRWSKVGQISDWDDDDYIDIATQGGQVIEGFGLLYDNLIIFLTDSIYKVSLVGGSELLLITKVSEGIGCIAKNSIQNVSVNNVETLIFLSRDGSINQFDGTNIKEISLLIHSTMDGIKTSRLPYAVSANSKQSVHYFLSLTNTDAATTNNLLLDYFYETGEWSKHTGIHANAMCVANNDDSMPQVYFGNYDAFVYQLDNADKHDDVYGFIGVFDSDSTVDTTTASGLDILYDTTFTFYDVLLMHCDGIDGSKNFTDEAGNAITAYGDAQIDTAQQKFGTGSLLCDGAGDYLKLSDSTYWEFSSDDFTVDFWWRTTTATNNNQYMIANDGGVGNRSWQIYYDGGVNDQLNVDLSSDGTNFDFAKYFTWTASADTWYHIEVVRNGNNLYAFVNGTQIGSTADVTGLTLYVPTASLYIAATNDGATVLGTQCYFDEVRISKGIARNTANFTSPTSAYDNSGISTQINGSTVKIISGTGKDDERLVCSSTTSGIIVTASTTATTNSEYNIGRIRAYYTTKWYNFGSMKRKNFKNMFLWTTKKSAETLHIFFADDEYNTIENLDLADYDVDNLWGTKIVSGSTVTWSGEELIISKIPLNISGRFLKTKFEEEGIGETQELHSYMYLYDELDYY